MLGGRLNQPVENHGSSASVRRKRRERTIFTLGAVRRLEAIFAEEHYPDIALREQLARQIGVSEARIQVACYSLFILLLIF